MIDRSFVSGSVCTDDGESPGAGVEAFNHVRVSQRMVSSDSPILEIFHYIFQLMEFFPYFVRTRWMAPAVVSSIDVVLCLPFYLLKQNMSACAALGEDMVGTGEGKEMTNETD